jgi:hypothetical protein
MDKYRSAPPADDLTVINGIGPAIAQRLNAAGILTLAQLGSSQPDEIVQMISDFKGFSADRIAQQDWVGQARQLTIQPSPSGLHNQTIQGKGSKAVYVVELSMDKSQRVNRTRVVHVQSQEESIWSEWDQDALVDFLIESSNLSLSGAREQEEHRSEIGSFSPGGERIVSSLPTGSGKLKDTHLTGDLRLADMQIMMAKDYGIIRPAPLQAQPINLRLTLDLSQVKAAPSELLFYSATVYCKSLGVGSYQKVGKEEGSFMLEDQVSIDIETTGLPAGAYRLEAVVNLTPATQTANLKDTLVAMYEGSPFQVY